MKYKKHTLEAFARILSVLALAGTFLVSNGYAGASEDKDPIKPAADAKTKGPGRKPAPDAGVAAAQPAASLKSEKEKQSYAMGMSLANQLRKQTVVVDPATFMQGLKDAFSGGKTLLTESEARAAVVNLQSELKKKQAALKGEAQTRNKQEGEAFLAANKVKEGVVTLESGLQYKILKAGDGKKPTLDDTVVCHYRGTLIDGTEFQSSYKRNQPATIAVKKAIKGWSEALELMPVGSKWQLFIPSNLAYGERGAGRDIGPNAALVFEVELISVKDTSGGHAQAEGKKDSIVPGVSAKQDEPEKAVAATDTLTGIQVSYKLDPRLTRGLYMGDRWVSPPTYTSRVPEGEEITVEARAHGLDAKGMATNISPKWTPADPEMVTVTPTQGNEVRITVQRAGESSLKVESQGVSRTLYINAAYQDNAIRVAISQKP